MVTKIELFETPGQIPLDICLWDWMKSEVHKTKVDTAGELLARILHSAASINKRGDQLKRTARDFRTRVAKGVEVDGGICEHLL